MNWFGCFDFMLYNLTMTKIKQPKHRKWINELNRRVHSYNYLGIVFAVGFFCFSLYPSLLPRTWLFQGLVSAVAIAIGYGIGTLASFFIRWLFEKDILIPYKQLAWKLLYIIGGLLVLSFLIMGGIWQNDLRGLLNIEPDDTYILRVLVLTIILGVLLIRLGRSIRKLNSKVYARFGKYLPRRISAAVSIVLVIAFITWIVSGAFIGTLGAVGGYLYNKKNRSTAEGIYAPKEPTRSGSPTSYISWDTLGYQGQKFVAQGPNQQQLSQFTKQPAKQQIRIYSGVNSASTAQERSELAVKELERTKAFDRKILVIAIPTGTGWLSSESMDSLEYIYGGDSAIVAQQYSYLPSWISFLVDKQKAEETGQSLYTTVYDKWVSLPLEKRPKLIIYGLSLGAFGGQSAFASPSAMIHSVDGALWQGTPGDTELWKTVSTRRDPGSPEWQPAIDGGRNIRFASNNQDILRQNSQWAGNRVLYMQHGSDPIVWFNFDLPFHKPDWYSEKRAPDVMNNTVWVPMLSFFQLAADQVVGMGVPKDFGHNYETTVARAWAMVTNPPNWNEQKSSDLQKIIDQY